MATGVIVTPERAETAARTAPRDMRARTRGRSWLLPLGAWAATAAVYTVVAVLRHRMMYTSGFDLGIFVQGTKGYASFDGPVASLKGPGASLLGDHFSPIMALLAPAYAVAPSPLTLLVAQALLVSSCILPLSRWALEAAGRAAALVVAVMAATSFGLTAAIGFDVHEVMWAVPMLAWSCTALGRRRYGQAVLSAAPLVLVKEDLGLTVAMVGAVALLGGARRLGLAALVGGAAATALEIGVLVPLANQAHRYDYLASAASGGVPLVDLVGQVAEPARWVTFLALLAPTLFFALRSPILLVAVPTLAVRLLTSAPAYSSADYHYNAVLVPIVVAAFVDGLIRWRAGGALWTANRQRAVLALGLCAALVLGVRAAAPTVLSVDDPARAAAAERARSALAMIPSGDSVAASNDLVPQVVAQHDVTLLGQFRPAVVCPEWIVRTYADGPLAGRSWPWTAADQDAAVDAARRYYRTVHAGDIEILRRDDPALPVGGVITLSSSPSWTCRVP